jgi:hypothetical protein
MRITNQAVLALGAIFLVIGLIALPFDVYLWRLAQLAIVLVVGIVLNAAGAMGAGDSKFIAVAAPFIAQGDAPILCNLAGSRSCAQVGQIHPPTPHRATLAQLGSRQEIPNGPCPCLNTGMLFGTWRSARRKLRPNYHLHPATILTE